MPRRIDHISSQTARERQSAAYRVLLDARSALLRERLLAARSNPDDTSIAVGASAGVNRAVRRPASSDFPTSNTKRHRRQSDPRQVTTTAPTNPIQRFTMNADGVLISLERRTAQTDATSTSADKGCDGGAYLRNLQPQPAGSGNRQFEPTSDDRTPLAISQCSVYSDGRKHDQDSDEIGDQLCYTDAELSAIDRDKAFIVPPAMLLEEFRREGVQAMRSLAMELVPCCVCELDYDHCDICVKDLTTTILQNMRRCLSVPDQLPVPSFIIEQYDASSIDVRLNGLMLFRPAISNCGGTTRMQLCKKCLRHLETQSTLPPTLSIVNGNFIGQLPDRFKLTRTDEQAVALLAPCMSLSTVTGGACRTIKSHHYVVENTEGPVVGMLPSNVDIGVRVAMVGSMTPAQVAACRKRYQLNVSMCREIVAFLNENNREYIRYQENHAREEMERQLDSRARTCVIVDLTTPTTPSAEQVAGVEDLRDDSTYSRFGSAVTEGTDPALESIWEERSHFLIQPSCSEESAKTDILVRKSNKYATMKAWEVCVKMFPTLFPGGCGGPLEPRARHMSIKKWIRRCLRVHGHRFEQHYAFLLLAFDYLASENARKTLFVKMHVVPTALKAADITNSTLKQAMEYFNHLTECRARGINPGKPPPDVAKVINIRRGLRTPESAFYGSNLSRMRARHDLFGMLKRFGPVQLFLTVSPDSAGTYSIAIKAGGLNEEAVRDANLLLLPNRAERRSIAAKHPAECAKYFMRVIDTVIETFLGWDQKRQRPQRQGGIFGVVRAFGGAAETQIAGDLHAHFVVWLHGFPQTSTAIRAAMDDDEGFRSRLIQLADAILTTKPPCLTRRGPVP